jgi:dethiobiotin synthetase
VKHLFITGTDTEIGKTIVSAGLVRALQRDGSRVAGMKPVAAGFTEQNGQWINEDVERLRRASNIALADGEINPVALRPPIAPHIAAEQAGMKISLAAIHEAFSALTQRADRVVVEGVGGFRVPLGPQLDTADLALDLGLPVVLVVGLRLGCINHALLTAEAVRARGLTLAGWVGNCIDPDMKVREENIRALDERLGCPRIGCIPSLPHGAADDANLVAPYLNPELLTR